MTNRTAAREAQVSSASGPITFSAAASSARKSSAPSWHPAMTRTEFTRYIFASLDAIVADRELPPNAFGVAYVISQHLDRETNEAFPGTDVIADEAGMAQSTVRAMVDKLAERGHYAVEFGRRGSGHSNKYRLTALERTAAKPGPEKQRPLAISEQEKQRPVAILDEAGKERIRRKKQRPVAMNHYNHLERGFAARLVDRGNLTDSKTADDAPSSPDGNYPFRAPDGAKNPDDARVSLDESPEQLGGADAANAAGDGAALTTPGYNERDFQHLREIYPNRNDEAGARLAFCMALREGATVEALTIPVQRFASRNSKGRTLAKFIAAGHWRGYQRPRDERGQCVRSVIAGHARAGL